MGSSFGAWGSDWFGARRGACDSHICDGREGQGKGERGRRSSGSVARSGCPKEHLSAIGRWVREAGLGTHTGWEAEEGPGVSESSRVVVQGEGPGDCKGEGRDQVR